ncbi:MAG TPA: hypothetical protein DHV48_00625 [Prolixibacteraceae bacterium]|nr:hypothetical protein [Prolixibacteraceae bacterium]
MMLSIRHTAKKYFVYLIIGLMGLMIINKAIFLHSHILDDGTIVTHAHPCESPGDSQPFKTHHHTKAAFFFYENLDLLFLSAVLSFFSFIRIQSGPVFHRLASQYTSFQLSQLHGRAPPAFL